MGWKQKENAIKEKRTLDATKKNYMGPSGKLGIIATTFGSPIVRQGSGLFDAVFMDDPYDDFSDIEFESTASGQQGPLMYEDKIRDGDEDSIITEEGYIFDGLSRGIHMEIKFWHLNNQIVVTYKGVEVYKEAGGELFCYAPDTVWEHDIERIYKSANKKHRENKVIKEKQMSFEIEEKKKGFWQKLRSRWGV